MSDQKKVKPKIEDVISNLLNGNKKENALDIILYLRENKMLISRNSGNAEAKQLDGVWKASYKGKGVCRIWFSKDWWSICPYADYTKEFEDFITSVNENLHETIWNNIFKCHRCHPHSCALNKENEETFVGHKKVYFGREFNNVCKHWDAWFHIPDEKKITCIKSMIDYNKQSILNNLY